MDFSLLGALIGFAFVTSVTPGPNNMMLMASGANFGLRRTLPHMLGVSFGFAVMAALLGLGIDRVFALWPGLGRVLGVAAMGYILWLAWHIAKSGAPKARTVARPMSFLQACAFQWVNPKAWAMALSALAAYAPGLGGVLVVACVFALVNLPTVSLWAAMGQGLRGILADPLRLRIFNIVMAVALVVSMLPVLSHGPLSGG